jgi:hypothetical protein
MEFIDDLKGIGPLRENENSKVLHLGCLFLFYRNLFWGLKNRKNRIPEDLFFSCVFWRNVSQERGFGRGLRHFCFWPLSQEFFCRNSGGTGIPVLTPYSSGFLRIPAGFLFPPKLSSSGQQLKRALC